MPLIILRISNAMIRETLLPDPNLLFLPKTIGISPLMNCTARSTEIPAAGVSRI